MALIYLLWLARIGFQLGLRVNDEPPKAKMRRHNAGLSLHHGVETVGDS